jgi:hypothetical protein
VNIVAYVDESGTHDPEGLELGADAVVICGVASTREDWISFDRQWRSILKKYDGVESFHFRQVHQAWLVFTNRRKPSSDFRKNPYRHWDENKLRKFIFELAPLAGSRLVIGGWVPTKLYHEDKMAGVAGKEKHPYELCLDHLFNSTVDSIKTHKSPWKRQPISFVFDHSENKEWRDTVTDRFYFHKKQYSQFNEIGFKHKEEHMPLQAADMISYRFRSNMSGLAELDFSKAWPELDDILFKSINQWSEKLSQSEKDAMLRRVFKIPKHVTYEQAMDSIKSKSRNSV